MEDRNVMGGLWSRTQGEASDLGLMQCRSRSEGRRMGARMPASLRNNNPLFLA